MPSAAPTPPPQDDEVLSPLLALLVARGETHSYRKGTILIHEGDRGETLFIIRSGRLRAYSVGERDREVTYGHYGPGEYVGEMSLDGGPRSASIITLENSTCTLVTRHTLHDFIAEHPDFAFELLTKVIRRARALTTRTKQLALNDVYGRLVAHLNSLALARPDGTRVIVERMTHASLSQVVGCSREMISRLMKELETGGYLVHGDGHMCLPRTLPPKF